MKPINFKCSKLHGLHYVVTVQSESTVVLLTTP